MNHSRIRVDEIWIAKGKKSIRIEDILCKSKELDIPVRLKKEREISSLLPDVAHQGIVALADKFIYADLDHIIDLSFHDQGRALLVAADHITDEGNLGALIRTAAFFGADGLVIPKDRSARVTARVFKRSAGACVHLPIARVVNMARALDIFKNKGYWVIGTSGDGPESIYEFDWNRDLVLAFGNERKGLSRSVLNRCHQVVGIPSTREVESLNISVAGGVILSEIYRQRQRPPY